VHQEPRTARTASVELASAIHQRRRVITATTDYLCRIVIASIGHACGDAAPLMVFRTCLLLLHNSSDLLKEVANGRGTVGLFAF
jgi:hypothetical protein